MFPLARVIRLPLARPAAVRSAAHHAQWRSFVGQALKLAGGAAIAQGLTVASMPLLSRLYTPADFSQLGMFLAFVFLAAPLAAGRFDVAVVSAKNDSEAAGLLALGLLLTVPTSLMASLGLILLRSAGWLGFDNLSWTLIVLAPPTIMAGGAVLALRHWCVRREATGAINAAVWSQAVIRTLLQVGAGAAGMFWGLAAGELGGRLAAAAPLAREFRSELLPRWRRFDGRALMLLAQRYRHFPRFGAPSTALNTLSHAIAVPLMVWAFGPVEGGVFALVQRLMALPVVLLGRGVADAFHGALARGADDRQQSLELLVRAARGMALLCLPPAVVFLLSAPRGLPWLLGPNWEVSGRLAAAMTPWIFGQMVVSPLGQAAAVFSGYRLKLLYDSMNLATITGVVGYAACAQWELLPTITLLSWLQLLNYGVYFLVLRWVILHARPGHAAEPPEGEVMR